MTDRTTFQGRSIWRIAILFAFALSVVLAAINAWGSRPAAAAQPAKVANSVATSADAAGSTLGDICIWSGLGFMGTKRSFVTCGVRDAIDHSVFNSFGSWDNNQTTGTQAMFFKPGGSLLFTSAGAHVQTDEFDFTDIGFIQPC